MWWILGSMAVGCVVLHFACRQEYADYMVGRQETPAQLRAEERYGPYGWG